MRLPQILLLIILLLGVIPLHAPSQDDIVIYLEARRTETGFEFNPDTIVMVESQPVTIIYNNTDSIPHDFNVEYGDDKLIHFAVFANTTADIVQDRDIPAGEYPFECSIAGHAEAGMVGTLYVAADYEEYQSILNQLEENREPTFSSQTPLALSPMVFTTIVLAKACEKRRQQVSEARNLQITQSNVL